MKTIILGPPGTGKTTTLLDLVDDFLASGIKPNKIGYFSFTRKAANEAIERASERFQLDPKKELIHFRTLHSMAFRLLGANKDRMMQINDYKEFGNLCGIPIRKAAYSQDDGIFDSDNEYLKIINNARVKNISVLEEYDKNVHNLDIERNTLVLIDQELTKFKKERGMKDFTDLIIDFVQKDLAPSLDVLFIDEAQDLSLIQWQMVKAMWKKAKKTYIAGDDDQAIFKWAGADISHFIALKNEVDNIKVLDQSHRIPGGPIHELSQRIISKISDRYEKEYKPREEEGILEYYTDLTQVDMSRGQWLVLSSANYFLEDVKDLCELQGWYFSHRGKNSISLELLLAINNWEKWRKGGDLSYLEIKNIYKFLGPSVTPGYNSGRTLRSDERYTIDDCKNDHGLLNSDVWFDSFKKLSNSEENYIRNMLAKGEKINQNPRISLSTIHAAKGGECDNVLILPDLSNSAVKSYDNDPDETHRLFYVGVTRAKKSLHIVEPRNTDKAYIL